MLASILTIAGWLSYALEVKAAGYFFFEFSDNRISLLGCPVTPVLNPQPICLRICDPRRQGGPAIPPGTGFPFSRLLRYAWSTLELFLSSGHRTQKVIKQQF
jgi:hypothetical protein